MPQPNKKPHQLRIIGGRWRGRSVHFPDIKGLRPTPDRVRETLFNWLQHDIADSICLDLFAGSGALSFEALSRGAKKVICVDQHPEVIAQLKHNATRLGAPQDALTILKATVPPLQLDDHDIDIVFLDPPFRQNILQPTLDWLHKEKYLNKQATLYIEHDAPLDEVGLPEGWCIVKEKKAGNIYTALLKQSDLEMPER